MLARTGQAVAIMAALSLLSVDGKASAQLCEQTETENSNRPAKEMKPFDPECDFTIMRTPKKDRRNGEQH